MEPTKYAEVRSQLDSYAKHTGPGRKLDVTWFAEHLLANLKGRKPSQLTAEELEVYVQDALENCNPNFFDKQGNRITSYVLYTP